MKKILFVALALLASASFSTASAQSKKEKKSKKKAQTEQSCCQDQPAGMPGCGGHGQPGCEGHGKAGHEGPGQMPCCMQMQPVQLVTPNDSISYAAGYMLSDGLTGYLKQQFGIEEKDMPAVIQSYRQAIARRDDPRQKAMLAGMQVAEMLSSRMVPRVKQQYQSEQDSLNEAMVYAGFEAALRQDTTHYQTAQARELFNAAAKEVADRQNKAVREAGEKFLADNAKQDGVKTLPSGLQYKVLQQGTGNLPTLDDKVQVVYEGRTIDGLVFDATSKHNLSADKPYDEFGVKGLIKGWQEALTIMPVGSKWEIYIPYNLAYGERGAGKDIKPYSALVFTMELKGIVKTEPKADTVTPAQKANPRTVTSKTAPVARKRK